MMRVLRWFLASTALLLVIAVVALWLAVRASLPILDGELLLKGLESSATIERDIDGTATITAQSRTDLAFATGFAHAQDRFFQMDMFRRAAAGELAELLGPTLVDTDKRLRMHGFRPVARQVIERASEDERAVLGSYVDGVNAGLSALQARPWEYLVLGSAPSPWLMEDSMLAAFAMYLTLNDPTAEDELAREYLRRELPPDVFAFLHPLGTEWDAPMAGSAWRVPPIPPAEIFDMRQLATSARIRRFNRADLEPARVIGSNSWAVAGTHTDTGAAVLANDMHLGLRLPNTWYRARLVVGRDGDAQRDLVGVTLPGLPVLVAGSNRHVAWGYTNSYGDWTDLVVVDMDPQQPSHYLVGDQSYPLARRREEIKVRGAPSVVMEIQTTQWGPIVRRDSNNRALALAWTAHRAEATNLGMLNFEASRSVGALLDAANAAGGPVQNVLAADAAGNIGWSVLGRVPRRANYDSTRPSSWQAVGTGWVGWREAHEYPRIVDPPTGRLWTANTRTLDAQTWMAFMGDGGHDLGARAAQIRDSLFALRDASIADLAKIQADDRALFLVRWRDLLLELLNDAAVAESPARREARQLVERWSARAQIDDVGYRIVREFRLRVRAQVFDSFTATARAKHGDMRFAPSPQFEGALWQLVTERPTHLLERRFTTWDAALLNAFDEVLKELQQECDQLAKCTWGRQNTLQMRHPLSAALPFASRWLDMPQQPLPGDAAMPRVQGTQFGASQRLVVSPGREAKGIFQMPGGPVNHPFSPFYAAGHEAWTKAEPQPLLPGPPAHRLQLQPTQ